MHRREFVIGGLGLAASTSLGVAWAKRPWDSAGGAAFDGSMVRQLARELAQSAFSATNEQLPPELKDLSYDVYRTIRFRPEQALWRDGDLPFQVQFSPEASSSGRAWTSTR